MSKTIVVYGSSTGTCEAIAEKIAQKLGCEAINVQDLTADVVNANQNLILGTSTWGAGELQDDWYDGLKVLKADDMETGALQPFQKGVQRPLILDYLLAPMVFAVCARDAVSNV